MNRLWVSAPTDRIQRAGASVVISSAGSPTISPASGQVVSITGPVSASMAVATAGTGAVRVAITDAGAATLVSGWRGADRRVRVAVETNDDITFHAVTGAGVGTSAEALRISNANSYVSVASRLGVGIASPTAPFHVVGDTFLQGYLGLNVAPSPGSTVRMQTTAGTNTVSTLTQGAATATAPVLVVKLGATPGAGGDGIQVQNSGGTPLFVIGGAGHPKWASATLVQTTVGAAGAAPALPATPTKYLQVRDEAGTLLVIPAYAAV